MWKSDILLYCTKFSTEYITLKGNAMEKINALCLQYSRVLVVHIPNIDNIDIEVL